MNFKDKAALQAQIDALAKRVEQLEALLTSPEDKTRPRKAA